MLAKESPAALSTWGAPGGIASRLFSSSGCHDVLNVPGVASLPDCVRAFAFAMISAQHQARPFVLTPWIFRPAKRPDLTSHRAEAAFPSHTYIVDTRACHPTSCSIQTLAPPATSEPSGLSTTSWLGGPTTLSCLFTGQCTAA